MQQHAILLQGNDAHPRNSFYQITRDLAGNLPEDLYPARLFIIENAARQR